MVTTQKIETNYQEIPLEETTAQGFVPQTNTPATPTSDSNIVSSANGSVLAGGAFQSPNFVTGSSGWIIRADGSVEFGSGKFRGDITGASGTFTGTITATAGAIGGWSISSTAIYFDGATDALSAGMAPADYPFYAGKKYANRATAPFKVAPSGQLTASDIVATGTINAQAGYLASGVYIDTVNGLLCESGGINVGTSGHIRGGQTDYNTGAGFFLGYSGGAYKFSVGDPTGKYINWTGTDFVVNGFVVSSKGAFGGDGSDGALAITSGTTTLDVGAVSVYIKNYTSISITGTTGKLAFSNPASGGTVIIIKSQGAVVLTSTVTVGGVLACLDVSGMGGTGGNGGTNGSGTAGTGNNFVLLLTDGGDGGTKISDTTQTPGGAAIALSYNTSVLSLTRYSLLYTGAGGGGGGGTGTGGAGGRGAGGLLIECAGDLNFPNTAGIYAKGTVGVDGTGASAAGGGGGGGGGVVQLIYKTATASNGTITVTGGTGGGYIEGATAHGGGGGGSKSAGTNGLAGGSGNTSPGGTGGAGVSSVTVNNDFA